MRDPFIAVDAGTDLRSHARALRRSWDAVLGGGPDDGGVRPLITASWRRAAGAGIDPAGDGVPRRAFADDELDDRRDASGLHECIDALRSCLGGFAHDAEHLMVVTDPSCRILWIEGDRRVRTRADAITFTEGMYWTEDSVGTNAIGTALAIDHAVQVFSAEHFAEEQHPWWCSAAPVRDPVDGRVLGVVDLSGPMRTAHPHSLALVTAAAQMAQETLRTRRALADERLRRTYLERTLGTGRRAHGLAAADGRVLRAESEEWDHARLDVPAGGGPVALPGGGAAFAEPLEGGRGFVLWDARDRGARAPAALRLELLTGAATARVGTGDPVELGARHADLCCLLALHPEGLAAEELIERCYPAGADPVTLRAEISRLRRALGGHVAGRPYRLDAAVSADVLDVRRALRDGRTADALAAYRGPLLPGSRAPGVVAARDELHEAVRRAAAGGDLDGLWAWLHGRAGRDDAEAHATFVRRAGPGDARRPVAAARLRTLRAA